jgi:amino acid adenylation domain-containing protein
LRATTTWARLWGQRWRRNGGWGQYFADDAFSLKHPGLVSSARDELLGPILGADPRFVALAGAGSTLTYAQLNAASGRFANALIKFGVAPDDAVGIHIGRSIDYVVAAIAALRLGALFVPLDPDLPASRLEMMRVQAACRLVVTADRWPGDGLSLLGSDAQDLAPAPPNSSFGHAVGAYALFTSGSTGTPKCVVIERRNLLSFLNAMDRVAPLTTPPVGLAVCPFGFDVSVWEIFSVLRLGGQIRLIDHAERSDGAALARASQRTSVTNLYIPPALLEDFVSELELGEPLTSLERVLVGVEPIPKAVLSRLRTAAPNATIVNGYGPTETTVCATAHVFQESTVSTDRVPIGTALPRYFVALVDEEMRPVRSGDQGEIVIGGPGVGRGYANDPVATADRFIPDHLSGIPGGRLYRTGDLARASENGNITFLGRQDQQVKIRGFRVELGEVEAAILRLAPVRRAVVTVLAGERSSRLIAFVEADADLDPVQLRLRLTDEVPPYAVPDRLFVTDRLPLTINGKIDGSELRTWLRRRPPLESAVVPPRSEEEVGLARCWCEVLDLDDIGIDDDFVALGGNSLLAVAAAREINRSMGFAVTGAMILRAQTITVLARDIHRLAALRPIQSPQTSGGASPGQLGLWTLQQLEPGNRAFYIPWALAIEGPIAATTIKDVWVDIVRRHEALRTRFKTRGSELIQEVGRESDAWVELLKVPVTTASESEVIVELVEDALAAPMDLGRACWRAWVLEFTPSRHVLLAIVHHIVFDGTSLRLLVEDILARLDGANPAAAVPARSAQLEQSRLASASRPEDESYWRDRLRDLPDPIKLRADHPRKVRQSSGGDCVRLRIDRSSVAKVDEVARRCGTTRFTVLLSAVAMLVQRFADTDDFVICTPVSTRETAEAEAAVGYFVNLVPLRLAVPHGISGDDFVQRVNDELVNARVHSRLAFEDLSRLDAGPDRLNNSFLTRMVVVEEVPLPLPARARDVEVTQLQVDPGTAKYELTVSFEDAAGELSVCFEYATDLYERETVARLAHHFTILLSSVIREGGAHRADELEILDPSDLEQLTVRFNQKPPSLTIDHTLTALFARQVAERPGAVAVIDDQGQITYAELDAAAGRLAGALVEAGMRPGDAVLVAVARSAAEIIAVMAVLKGGGYYVPVDTALPPPRMLATAEASRARLAIVDDARPLAGLTIPRISVTARGSVAQRARRTPLSAAYAMFTSGSTGVPKGVIVPDQAIVRLVCGQTSIPLGPDDTLLRVSAFPFDAATLEIWGALLNGGRVVCLPEHVVKDPAELALAIEAHRATVGFFNVALFQQLVRTSVRSLRSFHTLLVGGEAVPAPLMLEAGRELGFDVLLNGYGPTENTTFSCCHRLTGPPDSAASIPVGRPITGSAAYVLDNCLKPAPVGALGQIAVGGRGLAYGYLNDATMTAERFIPDTLSGQPGERLYLTGDLGYWLSDGCIEYAGRRDEQVKVRGYRIELREVEQLLETNPQVERAVALTADSAHGRQLLAFVERRRGSDMTSSEVRGELLARAPDYLVPSHIVVMDRFPENQNGKVDRASLRTLRADHAAAADASQQPTSVIERRVAAIWCELLGLNDIGLDEHFFDVGGDSLRLITLRDRLASEFGVRLPAARLIELPTVRTLAQHLREPRPRDGGLLATQALERAARRRARIGS